MACLSMLFAILFDSRTAFYATVAMALLLAGIRGNDYSTAVAMMLAFSELALDPSGELAEPRYRTSTVSSSLFSVTPSVMHSSVRVLLLPVVSIQTF